MKKILSKILAISFVLCSISPLLAEFYQPCLIDMFRSTDQEPTLAQVNAAIDQGAEVVVRLRGAMTPLIAASASISDPEIIKTLIRAGADVNASSQFYGLTPLLAAARNPNPEVTIALIKAGADLNADNGNKDGMTPLMIAAHLNQNPEVISALLKAGANTKLRCTKGKTALDYAKDNEHIINSNAYQELSQTQVD